MKYQLISNTFYEKKKNNCDDISLFEKLKKEILEHYKSISPAIKIDTLQKMVQLCQIIVPTEPTSE